MADQVYTNPDALLQLTAPQPGAVPDYLAAGYGPLEGALRGQAANRANQLFDLNMASSAQSLASQQAQAREWNQFAPYRLQEATAKAPLMQAQAQQAAGAGAESQATASQKTGELGVEQAAFAGNYADRVNQAAQLVNSASTDEAKQAAMQQGQGIMDQYKREFMRSFPKSKPDPIFDKFDPQGSPQVFNAAKDYMDRQERVKMKMQEKQLGSEKGLMQMRITSEQDIAKMRTEAEKAIANAHNKVTKDIADLDLQKSPEWLKQKVIAAEQEFIENGGNVRNEDDPNNVAAFDKMSPENKVLMKEREQILNDMISKIYAQQVSKGAGMQSILEGLQGLSKLPQRPFATPTGNVGRAMDMLPPTPGQSVPQQPQGPIQGMPQPQQAPQTQTPQQMETAPPGTPGSVNNPWDGSNQEEYNRARPGHKVRWKGAIWTKGTDGKLRKD